VSHPLVSVVIPTYNRAAFVGKAIESVLVQGVSDLQILVVDDGSTDDTPAALAPFAEHIKVIRQTNAGVSAARNRGMREAKGRWVAFLDSDDEWHPGKLERQLADLEGSRGAIAHVVNTQVFRDFAHDVDMFSLGGLQMPADQTVLEERPLITALKHKFARVQSTLVSREALGRAGFFDESMTILEDLDLLFRLTLEGPWLICSKAFTSEIRREEETVGLGNQRLSDPVLTSGFAVRLGERVLADDRITAEERSVASWFLARQLDWSASAQRRKGSLLGAWRARLRALGTDPSARRALRLLLP